MSITNGHINQRLTNFIIQEQLLAWDKNNFFDYKSIYQMLKV